MIAPDRLALINRLSRTSPDDLDALLQRFDLASTMPARTGTGGAIAGREIAPCPAPGMLPPLRLARQDAVAVGFIVTEALQDPCDVAFRLAALAVEQDVEIIVLTTLDYSGLERFGFRTERLAGQSEAELSACRMQLEQFWGIELTLPT